MVENWRRSPGLEEPFRYFILFDQITGLGRAGARRGLPKARSKLAARCDC